MRSFLVTLMVSVFSMSIGTGCVGGAAYVLYRGTEEIRSPETYSVEDKVSSRSIRYYREKFPPADRVESEGTRTTFHYDNLGMVFGGPVIFVAPGYPIGMLLPVPLGRKKLSLTFESGTLVSSKSTGETFFGLAWLYFPIQNSSSSQVGRRPPYSGMPPDILLREPPAVAAAAP